VIDMPRGDGTGPMGQGPGMGRGMGEEDEAEQGREEIVFVQAAELKSPIKQVRLVPQ